VVARRASFAGVGDQMLQHDDRIVYGAKASKTWLPAINGVPMSNVDGL